MISNFARSVAAAIAVTALLWAETAGAEGYRGAPFSAETWFGTEDALELRYNLYIGKHGYRLESINPVEGPDIIIAQFTVPRFVYIDVNTGAVNFLPMGENDWGRFSGIACADFEYRQQLGTAELSGRAVEIWQCIGSKRYKPDTRIWWDPVLLYQVRSDEEGYITELRNIRPGNPDAALFEIPADPK